MACGNHLTTASFICSGAGLFFGKQRCHFGSSAHTKTQLHIGLSTSTFPPLLNLKTVRKESSRQTKHRSNLVALGLEQTTLKQLEMNTFGLENSQQLLHSFL
jgi:hypothetical protein